MDLVVGDIHGCYEAFKRLLKKSKFRPEKDRLWLTGDLINRGPKSAEVVRYVMDLGERANVVLGNHDLHLLAVAAGVCQPKRNDNSHLMLDEPDADEMVEWLASRPLALFNEKHGFLLVHASVHKHWSTADTLAYAGEIQSCLQGETRRDYLKNMYGSKPANWSDELKSWQRERVITNILTRARFCKKNGALDLMQKGPPGSQPKTLYPWFDLANRKTADQLIFFGHWSALGFHQSNNAVCLDSGYLWGGKLTALKLKKRKVKIIQVNHD